jgi:hypothetical protein
MRFTNKRLGLAVILVAAIAIAGRAMNSPGTIAQGSNATPSGHQQQAVIGNSGDTALIWAGAYAPGEHANRGGVASDSSDPLSLPAPDSSTT